LVVYDLEAKEPKSDEEDWIEYKVRAGLGCGVTYDFTTDAWEVYFEKDIDRLVEKLEKASAVVSYNGIGFDHILVDCIVGRRVFVRKEIDLWEKIKAQKGERLWPKGSWTLGGVCERTIGVGKEKIGAFAPELLAKGETKTVLDYCIKDVRMCRDLYLFVRKYGYVMDPENHKLVLSLD
jgi:hypothetical protein